jgi:hypothetical protein
VNFWGHTRPDDVAAHVGAIGEIIGLNSPDLLQTGPKVLRLPSVLTGRDLAGFVGGQRERDDSLYSILETEAITMALDAGAGYKGRVILIPRVEAPVRGPEIPAVLNGSGVVRGLPQPQGETTLFPNEAVKASILRGAQEVVSPSYPASDELFKVVSDHSHLPQVVQKEQLAGLHAALFERGRAVRYSAD